MKKILYSVFALAIAAFTFTSCEDVPAPYDTPQGGQGGQDLPEGVYVDESFSNSFGSFTEFTTKGTPWVIDFSTAKGSGYDNNSQTTTESESYLVSSEIDLTESTGAYIQFEYIYRYANRAGAENKVLITDSYTGDPTTTTWEDITGTLVEGSDWTTFSTYARNIDSKYLGKKIVIAFYYACTNNSSTWEVKNVTVVEGEVEEGGGDPEQPEEPEEPITGENLLENGGFETWSSTSQPDNWKSTTTASSAKLEQSTDAHSGSYSVKVIGDAGSNKRLAYKEITLKAGTYQMSFYAKAVESEGTVNIGYVPVTDGKVGQYMYKDNGYTDLSSTEWTEVTNTFTLDATTTVNLVVMNSKSPGKDVLIDDFSLITNDGGLSGEQPEEPVETTATYALATGIVSGSKYVIATKTSGNAYAVATPLGETQNYGFLQTADATLSNNSLQTVEDNEFTITEVSGGYTIQDKYGRYYYMDGTFNNFNVATDMPSSAAVFEITFNSYNTVSIKNIEKGKTLQYDEGYNSYGIYEDVTHQLPSFFVKK